MRHTARKYSAPSECSRRHCATFTRIPISARASPSRNSPVCPTLAGPVSSLHQVTAGKRFPCEFEKPKPYSGPDPFSQFQPRPKFRPVKTWNNPYGPILQTYRSSCSNASQCHGNNSSASFASTSPKNSFTIFQRFQIVTKGTTPETRAGCPKTPIITLFKQIAALAGKSPDYPTHRNPYHNSKRRYKYPLMAVPCADTAAFTPPLTSPRLAKCFQLQAPVPDLPMEVISEIPPHRPPASP